MPTAIILALEYKNPGGEVYLPSCSMDIYNAVNWMKSFDCNINLYTDIQSTDIRVTMNNMTHSINSAFAKVDTTHIINNLRDFTDSILSKTIEDDKIVVYYTGHGEDDSIVFPDRSKLRNYEFRDMILSILPDYSEVFWIMDCCNPSGMSLPFELKNNNFRLRSGSLIPVTQPVLLIVSANQTDTSVSTVNGSVFSTSLFELLSNLKNKNRNLNRFKTSIRHNIRRVRPDYDKFASIYSSYLTDPILWLWIGPDVKSDIVSDMSLSSLVCRIK